MAMFVNGFAYSYAVSLWIFSLVLVLVSSCLHTNDGILATCFKPSIDIFVVLAQPRHSETGILQPRQILWAQDMGTDTPTLRSFSREREFAT